MDFIKVQNVVQNIQKNYVSEMEVISRNTIAFSIYSIENIPDNIEIAFTGTRIVKV